MRSAELAKTDPGPLVGTLNADDGPILRIEPGPPLFIKDPGAKNELLIPKAELGLLKAELGLKAEFGLLNAEFGLLNAEFGPFKLEFCIIFPLEAGV